MVRPVLHELVAGFVIEDGSVFNDRPVIQTLALLLAWRASQGQVASTRRWNKAPTMDSQAGTCEDSLGLRMDLSLWILAGPPSMLDDAEDILL